MASPNGLVHNAQNRRLTVVSGLICTRVSVESPVGWFSALILQSVGGVLQLVISCSPVMVIGRERFSEKGAVQGFR